MVYVLIVDRQVKIRKMDVTNAYKKELKKKQTKAKKTNEKSKFR